MRIRAIVALCDGFVNLAAIVLLSAGSRGEESSEEDPPIDITTVQDMLSSHHYKSFKISMIHKLRFTTDVQLGTRCEPQLLCQRGVMLCVLA